MKKGKLGFTLIEVALFVAISGLLFIGVTAGVQTSIYQQRRNDSIQNFIEFLRGVYSEVENTQNYQSRGRSEQAIYGKLVTFGEEYNTAGTKVDNLNEIFVYTVIGNVDGTNVAGTSAVDVLSGLSPSIMDSKNNLDSSEGVGAYAGYVSSYTPKWGARIDQPCNNGACSYEPLKGALLIIRHPRSGNIYTYYRSGVMNVNGGGGNPLEKLASDEDFRNGFSNKQVDFCVNPTGEYGTNMADVRIKANSRNASGIELVPEESGVCKRN